LAGHFINKSWKIGEWQDCSETVKRQSVIAKIHITVAKTQFEFNLTIVAIS